MILQRKFLKSMQLAAIACLILGCSPHTVDINKNQSNGHTMKPDTAKQVSITGRVTTPSGTVKVLAVDAIVYLAATDAIPPQTDLQAITAKVKGGRLVPERIDLVVGQMLVVDVEGNEPYSLNFHSSQEPGFGKTLPMNMARWEKTFTKPTMMASVTCDIHPTFRGTVTVLPNRAFVRTLKDGSFSLSVTLPDGKYEIHAFLANHGRSSGSIEVKAGANATINFDLPNSLK